MLSDVCMFLELAPMLRGQPHWDVKPKDFMGILREYTCVQKQPLHREVRLQS